MNKLSLFLTLFVFCLNSTNLEAAESSDSTLSAEVVPHADAQIQTKARAMKLLYVDGKPLEGEEPHINDSIAKLIVAFYYDQFRNSQDPDMPFFLLMSKGSNLTLGIGGGVRFRGYYDWNGAMPSSAFSPYTIPVTPDPASPRHFGTTPSGTYLNFQLIGHNTKIGSYGLYIEADFTGYQGRDFKLKKSYAVIGNFTVGYATSTFSDPAAQPAIVDAAGPNNKFSNTSVLLRYMPVFKNGWRLAVSIETPQSAINRTGQDVRTVSDWLPDAAAFVQKEWAPGQHLRLSGIVRSLSYLTVADNVRHNLVGWGSQLSLVARPEMHLTTFATVNYGRGCAGLGGDLLHGQYDLVPEPDSPTTLYAPDVLGWCAGLQYNFKPNIFSTIAASQTHYMPHKGSQEDEYKYGTFACANIFWSILPRITVAAEYDWGMRRDISGRHKAASRINLTGMFTF